MIYSNDDPMAILAMEHDRTSNYGDCFDDNDFIEACPVCDAYIPDYLYINDYEECVGCSECIHKEYNI